MLPRAEDCNESIGVIVDSSVNVRRHIKKLSSGSETNRRHFLMTTQPEMGKLNTLFDVSFVRNTGTH